MECVSIMEKPLEKLSKPGLAFSIDKIIGTQSSKKENNYDKLSEDTEKSAVVVDKGEVKPFSDNDKGEKPISKNIETSNESGKDAEKSSLNNKAILCEEKGKKLQYHINDVSANQPGAILYDAEFQDRNIFSYQGKEYQDINMNLMSYLHPAFLLGRINPEEYRAHLLQNYYLQHQNPHINKDSSYALDLYKLANAQYLNAQALKEFKKPDHFDTLPANERLRNKNDFEPKSKFETKQSVFTTHKTVDDVRESRTESTKEFKDNLLETREKKFQNKAQKTFTCQECGKMFNAHYNLTRHMPVHTGKLYCYV